MRRTIHLLLVFTTSIGCGYLSQAMDLGKLRANYLRLTGSAQEERFTTWSNTLVTVMPLSETAKLGKVNAFFNDQLRFSDDQEIWNSSDYWATPMETLAKGAGDCEDFAIAKYYSLLYLGVPVERLRLTYVRARINGAGNAIVQAHMVLTYYPSPEAVPLVLDNLIDSILPASRRPDLQPVFSFNSQQIYAASSAASTSTSRLSRWQDLLHRAHNEGFDK
jgi:predicted transglutaminase-like cysteine proteinase